MEFIKSLLEAGSNDMLKWLKDNVFHADGAKLVRVKRPKIFHKDVRGWIIEIDEETDNHPIFQGTKKLSPPEKIVVMGSCEVIGGTWDNVKDALPTEVCPYWAFVNLEIDGEELCELLKNIREYIADITFTNCTFTSGLSGLHDVLDSSGDVQFVDDTMPVTRAAVIGTAIYELGCGQIDPFQFQEKMVELGYPHLA